MRDTQIATSICAAEREYHILISDTVITLVKAAITKMNLSHAAPVSTVGTDTSLTSVHCTQQVEVTWTFASRL